MLIVFSQFCCKYALNGCPETMAYKMVEDHELVCAFRDDRNYNCRGCGMLMKFAHKSGHKCVEELRIRLQISEVIFRFCFLLFIKTFLQSNHYNDMKRLRDLEMKYGELKTENKNAFICIKALMRAITSLNEKNSDIHSRVQNLETFTKENLKRK